MRLSRHALADRVRLSGISLGGIGAAADDAKSEIRIGQTLPYSGPVSGFGIIGRAQEAYFAKVNAEGGINGRKVKFICSTMPIRRRRRSSRPASWWNRTRC